MPRFPEDEPSIFALGQAIIGGARAAAADFRDCPISVDELEARFRRSKAADLAAVEADALSRTCHAAKDREIAEMIEAMKVTLAYAEITYRKTPEQLTGLGWGPRRPKAAPKPPGEVRDIAILGEGETWIKLGWKQPADGGKVKIYQIERRDGDGPWNMAGASPKPGTVLTDQPRGIRLSFRVIAVNKAGEGAPSGVVAAVL